jgi:nucleotide-binding universal stress UspA family protein
VTLLTAADPLLVRSWSGRERIQDRAFYAPSGDPDAYLAALAGLPLFDGLVVDRSVMWGLAEPAVAIGARLDRQPATIAAAVTHGRTGLPRVADGSTVARMVHGSRVPVLAVPASAVS